MLNNAEGLNNKAILGTYEGECADANITNNNGMDITRPVWEGVFNSEEYKQAVSLGWYIGFLGHPEDPNCMDFEHACIVMKEGYIDEDGKVYGKFDLIDTPVGRIVKAFQDAGVTFGISVRGAGDVVANSVDPDTFIFRGFDLVTFPAFPESIPTFTAIAASSDVDKQAKYRAVCKAVKSNLEVITSCSTIEAIQSQFAEQSDEYKLLAARKAELSKEDLADLSDKLSQEDVIYATQKKLDCMTRLYLDAVAASECLKSELESVTASRDKIKSQYTRKLQSVKRLTNLQMATTVDKLNKITAAYEVSRSANSKLKSEIEAAQKQNLKYKQKITAATEQIREQETQLSGLQTKLDETVNETSRVESQTSNLDAKCNALKSQLTAAQKLLSEYQSAYAALYASAIGVHVSNSAIAASTSVEELQSAITNSVQSATNTSSVFVKPDVIDADVQDYNEEDLVTL